MHLMASYFVLIGTYVYCMCLVFCKKVKWVHGKENQQNGSHSKIGWNLVNIIQGTVVWHLFLD